MSFGIGSPLKSILLALILIGLLCELAKVPAFGQIPFNGPANPHQASIPAPGFDVSPLSIDFSSVRVGEAPPTDLNVTNTGGDTLNISSVVSDNPAFTVSPDNGLIAGSESGVFTVTFTPPDTGVQTATITFTDNAPGSPHTITVTGTGVVSVAQLSTENIGFGTVNVGQSVTDTVTITNTGTASLNIFDASSDNSHFSLTPNSGSIAPLDSLSFYITFTPVDTTTQTGSISFTDDATSSPQIVAVSGSGHGPVISFSPSPLNFGGVLPGTSRMDSVLITNTGDVTLSISSIVSDSSSFTVSPSTGTVAPGAVLKVYVTFTPGVTSTRTGHLTLTHNASGSPSIVTLTGFGSQFGEVYPGALTQIRGVARWGDFDNDGLLDIFLYGSSVSSSTTDNATIYRNTGNGFSPLYNLGLVSDYDINGFTADFNNDGRLDIIRMGVNPSIGTNTGSGITDLYNTLRRVQQGSLDWGDYDNDGKLDFVVSGYGRVPDGPTSNIYHNTGSGFSEAYAGTLTQLAYTAVKWADFDNDGKLDILIAGRDGSNVSITKIYRNTGTGFVEVVADTLVGLSFAACAVGDYDNDGKLDIFLSGVATGNVPTAKLYRNTGTGFSEVYPGTFEAVPSGSAAWGDYDNDGLIDILYTGYSNAKSSPVTKLYRNTGTGFSEITVPGLTPVFISSVAWGDYNNDGKLDILLTGIGPTPGFHVFSQIFQNLGTTVNSPPSAPTGLVAVKDTTSVTLRWNRANDSQTPRAGLTYNIRIDTSRFGIGTVSPMANISTGMRTVPQIGNANEDTSWTFVGLGNHKYYWSVQAIDGALAGSAFSAVDSFATGSAQLAIQLGQFSAHAVSAGSVIIEWSTMTETNNYGFYVERRELADRTFARVSPFIPGAGTTLEEQKYSWTDTSTHGGSFVYRLRSVDLDGMTTFSQEITVNSALGVNEQSLPAEFALRQNYPNPFNPSTAIHYDLPFSSNVTLQIYNVLGQTVAKLLDGVEAAGYRSATFNPSDLPSGMYFYRLDATSLSDPAKHFSETRRMLLIR